MKLFASIYTDEDISVLVATLLRAKGFNATTTREQRMLGQSDRAQLVYAISVERCILTHNRRDFERLHLEYTTKEQHHWGIVIVPHKNPQEIARRVAILLDTLTADEIANQLLYV
ncbi:DUF5615 family PIN-like protein [Lusitaniella coriacea LEGE 07157]|uniref:DUF5615 family PIN-like protein n=1 Tax=Lusitaniella coriacea LEGE 07157 TaxID=945747 RepID=A0A8J7DYF6_9CYAN|nr:DUF5615 family PIN-like protein [Lusitaniella coriacea]MBE9117440.1 DUF5615 family PIN-like protein [Lusitaniella coriacea LEGE 07157]